MFNIRITKINLNATWCLLLLILTSVYVGKISAVEEETNNISSSTEITSICDMSVPDAVRARDDVWKYRETPAEDDLDRYMVNRTGCRYASRAPAEPWFQLPEPRLEGAAYHWRGALRTGEEAAIRLWWFEGPTTTGYTFWVGERQNTVSRVFEWYGSGPQPSVSTPGLLSRGRYLWFHLTLEPGRVTFRTECDTRVNLTLAVNIPAGVSVQMAFGSWSVYGGKLLYGCPLDIGTL